MLFPPECLFCCYRPCTVDAAFCTRCGRANPNPGVVSRLQGMLHGFSTAFCVLILGGLFASFGWAAHPWLGMGIAVMVLAAVSLCFLSGIWYAFDPTYGLAMWRGQASPFSNRS